jgi:hypothetical protein
MSFNSIAKLFRNSKAEHEINQHNVVVLIYDIGVTMEPQEERATAL